MACESHLNKGVEIATLPGTQPPGRGAGRACCGAATSAMQLSPAVDTSCGVALCKQKTYLPQATSVAVCLLEDDCLITLTSASLGLKVSILPTTRPQNPSHHFTWCGAKEQRFASCGRKPKCNPTPRPARPPHGCTQGFLTMCGFYPTS